MYYTKIKNNLAVSLIVFLGALALVTHSCQPPSEVSFSQMKINDMEEPIGVQTRTLKFSWQLIDSLSSGYDQSEVELAEDPSFSKVIFRPGPIENDQYFEYSEIDHLKSNTTYWWRVRVKPNDGKLTNWSSSTKFTTGILDQKEWEATLIGADSLSMMRKEFEVDKKVKNAYLNITSKGLYECWINGKRVGDRVLEPVQTNTHKRLVYATYNITEMLGKGKNAIGCFLGGGAYGHLYKSNLRTLLVQIYIEYMDGTHEKVVSDTSWKGYDKGPILYTGLYEGEVYDAREELDDWSTWGFDDSSWTTVPPYHTDLDTLNLYSQLQPIRERKVYPAKSHKKLNDTVTVYDLGYNITGYPKIRVSGKPGNKVKIRVAEILNPDHTINWATTGREWKLEYILKGGDIEDWKPKFTNSGFRYIEVMTEGDVVVENVKGIHIHSDINQTGEITTSNPLINKIQDAYQLSQTGNLMGFPTDCPHRERLGWLGDALQIGVASSYNYDMQYFFKKWFRDMDDDLLPNGSVHQLIPFPNFGDEQDPVWQSASIIMPYEMYWFYGDMAFLSDNYYRMSRMMDYYRSLSQDSIIDKNRWNDWVKPFEDQIVDGSYLTTAYYYKCATIMASTAQILGKAKDYEKYVQLAKTIRSAVNDRWYKGNHYDQNTQTANAIALDFGIAPEKTSELVLEELVNNIIRHNDHLTTGVVGQMPLVSGLQKYKRDDKVYDIVNQKTWPSLGYMLEQGGTTFWEKYAYGTSNWDSHNHVFLGGPHAKWFYDGLSGISPLEPGFKRFKIEPFVIIDTVNTEFDSPYGKIVCNWSKGNGLINLHLTVPYNTIAELHVPSKHRDPGRMRLVCNEKPIWDNNTNSSKEVKFKGIETGKLVYQLKPGTYHFDIYE